jgi:hypothetical protein
LPEDDVTAPQVLDALALSTMPESLTSEVTIQSGPSPHDTKTLRIASRYKATVGGRERYLMARILSGSSVGFRLLLKQQIPSQPGGAGPSCDLRVLVPGSGAVQKAVFVPWNDLPGTEIKNFDFVLPVPHAAKVLTPSPVPTGPGAVPPAACDVVELTLPSPGVAPGSDRILLWAETTAAGTFDYRSEHYRAGNLVRVVTAENDGLRRTTTNVTTGRSSVLTVTTASFGKLASSLFLSTSLPSGTW